MDTEDIDLPIFPLALACVALGVPILLVLSAVSDLLIDTCADLEKKCSPALKLIVKILRLFLLYLTAPITLAAILVALTIAFILNTALLLLFAVPLGVLLYLLLDVGVIITMLAAAAIFALVAIIFINTILSRY